MPEGRVISFRASVMGHRLSRPGSRRRRNSPGRGASWTGTGPGPIIAAGRATAWGGPSAMRARAVDARDQRLPALVLLALSLSANPARADLFGDKVAPLLETKCVSCHSGK